MASGNVDPKRAVSKPGSFWAIGGGKVPQVTRPGIGLSWGCTGLNPLIEIRLNPNSSASEKSSKGPNGFKNSQTRWDREDPEFLAARLEGDLAVDPLHQHPKRRFRGVSWAVGWLLKSGCLATCKRLLNLVVST